MQTQLKSRCNRPTALTTWERDWLESLARRPRRALNGWSIANSVESCGFSKSVRGNRLDRVHTITVAGKEWLAANRRAK